MLHHRLIKAAHIYTTSDPFTRHVIRFKYPLHTAPSKYLPAASICPAAAAARAYFPVGTVKM